MAIKKESTVATGIPHLNEEEKQKKTKSMKIVKKNRNRTATMIHNVTFWFIVAAGISIENYTIRFVHINFKVL